MVTVLAVEAAKLHQVRVVTDDGETLIDKTVWAQYGRPIGEELTDAEWQYILEYSAVYRAREKALYYLSLRDYGRAELISKLCQVGIERDRAEATVTRLVESGLIDDRRYARMLAQSMQTRKLYPKKRIAMALREKGFDADTVQEALFELPDEEEQQALELLRKKRYNGASDRKQRDKALAMLARYGFSYAVAQRALMLREEELTRIMLDRGELTIWQSE